MRLMFLLLKRSSKVMTREEELFRRRLLDLADTAWNRVIITYTDFLNLNEQNIYHDTLGQLSFLESRSYGGYEYAERQMIAFIPDALLNVLGEQLPPYPIACLEIKPLNTKFSDPLSHRDYLGSLMNLGIERSRTGDIVLYEDGAFLFCHEKITAYLCSELTRIRHTTVTCRFCRPDELHYEPHLEEITGTVASVRLDALLSLAFRTSRSSMVNLIEGGKTFVNGKMITSNGYHLKSGDIISVRGYGRFRFCEVAGATKKGRNLVKLQKYL